MVHELGTAGAYPHIALMLQEFTGGEAQQGWEQDTGVRLQILRIELHRKRLLSLE